MDVRIKILEPDFEAPKYANPGDAGLDLCSTRDLEIEAGSRALVPCGIAIEIPDGYAGLVIPRSGLAIKHGISIVNAPGLIDSGYRGEIKVVLVNTDKNHTFQIKRGDRIAQMMIIAYPSINLVVSEELSDTDRGSGGFGSTGRR